MIFICGRGKDEYLTGEIAIPEKNDPKLKVWKTENHMVMSWLINLMNNHRGENFLLFGTAKEIWDAVRETYLSSEIPQNYSKLKPSCTIYAREILPSLSISTLSLAIGKISTYSKSTHGSAPKT